MKFKDKKEYYSLRKFKGVGLASALVGLAFLAPNVMAEETATINVDNVSQNKSVINEMSNTNESIIVDTTKTLDKSDKNVDMGGVTQKIN